MTSFIQILSNVTGLMDLFTTALDIAKIPVPTDRIIDGKSLLSFVQLTSKYKYKSSGK